MSCTAVLAFLACIDFLTFCLLSLPHTHEHTPHKPPVSLFLPFVLIVCYVTCCCLLVCLHRIATAFFLRSRRCVSLRLKSLHVHAFVLVNARRPACLLPPLFFVSFVCFLPMSVPIPVMLSPIRSAVRPDSASKRKSVVWDEGNLSANAAYIAANPVLRPITEPPTPFAREPPSDDAEISETEGETGEASAARPSAAEAVASSWDPASREAARLARLLVPVEPGADDDDRSAPSASSTATHEPVALVATAAADGVLRRRPSVGICAVVSAEMVERDERHRAETEFRHMRKVVYKDEGKNFLAQLKDMPPVEDE